MASPMMVADHLAFTPTYTLTLLTIIIITMMDFFNSEYTVLGLFLTATLATRLWAGRGVKTMRDYALANKSLGMGVLTMTLLATYVGRGDIATVHYVYDYGLVECLSCICLSLSFLLVGLLIAPRMVRFSDCMTMGDVMGKLYGREARMLTAVVGVLGSLLIIAAQFQGIGASIDLWLPGRASEATICLGVFIVCYSAIGGMRTVALTNVLHFIALALTLLVLTHTLLVRLGGLQHLFETLPSEKLRFFSYEEFYGKLRSSIFLGLFPTFILSFPIVQRMLMIKEPRKARQMFLLGVVMYMVILLLLVLMGLCTISWFSQHPTNEVPQSPIAYFTKVLFANSPMVRGCLFGGSLAVLMSTIDSYLHAIGISTMRDLVNPLLGREGSNNEVHEIRWIRLIIALVGLLAIYLGRQEDPFGYNAYYYFVCVSALILVPFIIGVLGLSSDRTACFGLCFTYSMTLLFTYWIGTHKYTRFFVSISTGIVAFLVIHYISRYFRLGKTLGSG